MRVGARCTVGLALLIVLLASPSNGQSTGFAIAGLEAKLFYSNSGRLSSNILDNPKIVLHNTPIGEGTVEGPSESTLLIVRIQGPPKSEPDGLRLHMTATADGDTLADREVDVGPMNSTGNYYAACWLDDTGCQPVKIVLQLRHGKESQTRTAVIPFECSE